VPRLREIFLTLAPDPLPSDFVFNIHVERTGDGQEDLTFQFVPGAVFAGALNPATGTHEGIAIPVPLAGGPNSRLVKVALAVTGQVTPGNEGSLNYLEHYKLRVFSGKLSDNRDIDAGPFATIQGNPSSDTFRKPFDNAGTKTFPNGYSNYSATFIYDINIPGCGFPGRVFVGQRNDPFNINLGQVFDLINLIPAEELGGTQDPKFNVLARKSVTSFSLEVHKSCLTTPGGNSVIGAWGSVNYLKHVGPTHSHYVGAQKNRLGNPLINELVSMPHLLFDSRLSHFAQFIGLTDKDRWNYVHPSQESQFLEYYQYPTLPELVELLFGPTVRGAVPSITTSLAPNVYPRVDLAVVLLQGVPGLTQQTLIGSSQCGTLTAPPNADMLRLDANSAPTPRASQNPFGVLNYTGLPNDFGGFPNGRRPGDDIVDIFLRVGMGRLCHPPFNTLFNICQPSQAPIGNLMLTDRAPLSARDLPGVFPYLNTPLPGSLLPSDPVVPGTF
jgi:hypothetical protein